MSHPREVFISFSSCSQNKWASKIVLNSQCSCLCGNVVFVLLSPVTSMTRSTTYLLHGSTQSPQHFSMPLKFFSASRISALIWSIPSSIRSNCSRVQWFQLEIELVKCYTRSDNLHNDTPPVNLLLYSWPGHNTTFIIMEIVQDLNFYILRVQNKNI